MFDVIACRQKVQYFRTDRSFHDHENVIGRARTCGKRGRRGSDKRTLDDLLPDLFATPELARHAFTLAAMLK
jgi:hypothetical protein